MGDRQIRLGQLIAPFGPGSLYTDRRGTPLVICGLDHWFKRQDSTGGLIECEGIQEFQKFEPRLSALLQVDRFCSPPDFRRIAPGHTPPPNAGLHTPAHRFPRWYRNSKSGLMRRFNLHSTRLDNPVGGGRWLPVRFVAVCDKGHLCEFPWREWIDCQCTDGGELYISDRGGSELDSIRVECHKCPPGSTGQRGKSIAGTTRIPNLNENEKSKFHEAGIQCSGDRPWLGDGAEEPGCDGHLVGALLNQTNLYFPKTISAILLPDRRQSDEINELKSKIEEDPLACALGITEWRMGGKEDRADIAAKMQRKLTRRGITADESQILKALESLYEPLSSIGGASLGQPSEPESELLAFRRAEYNILREEVNDPKTIPNLRVISTKVPPGLAPWIAKVNLVERLRETRVFYGFDRLRHSSNPLEGMPFKAMNQLFRNPPVGLQAQWLPAVEVFGEGLYLELDEAKIQQWQLDNAPWLEDRLRDGFCNRLADVFQTLPPQSPANTAWASRYLLVHTLAHILITQLVFECGYSTASLRERLYISCDPASPMAGILIYTSAGDSEGTLGGLVSLGRPERIEAIFQRALSRASWCSADPVCSENLGGQGTRRANLAACHACVLLPETSCETINQGLDRAMVVGTPDSREPGFLSELLDKAFSHG